MSPPMPNHRSDVLSVSLFSGLESGGSFSSNGNDLPPGTNSRSRIIFGSGVWVDSPISDSWVDSPILGSLVDSPTSGSGVVSPTSGFGVVLINFPFVVHSGPKKL